MTGKGFLREVFARGSLANPRLDRKLLHLQHSFREAVGALELLDTKDIGRRGTRGNHERPPGRGRT